MSTPLHTARLEPAPRSPGSPRPARLPHVMPGQLGKVTALVAGIVLLLAALPILTMIAMSFSAADTLEFPPHAYSLHWYRAAWQSFVSPDATQSLSMGAALSTSLVVALSTMLIATLVSVPAAYALSRYRFRGKPAVEQLVALPLVYPLVMLGLSLLLVFNVLPVDLGVFRLVIAHVILALPFTVKNCAASVASIGPEFEEAACVMGASPGRALVDVILPLMRPGIFAGMLFAFIVSFNEFTVTFFLYSIDTMTLPVWLYSRTVSSLDPTVFCFAVFIVAIDFALIWLLEKLIGDEGVAL
ncbi:MAG: ABC-type spermidine/putrescine transport system, permease component II [uncultured Paraburkholderia sp.]|nr:MAG: ABC-type spermidine/putrescine transport system, permease component II [uncultured Paraburkholderia sp.]CAH2798785.1 MAG: ABC-type spermidine/putrescine transport system, permease component II [uncultured Paraburkholderia sp.]CAH2933193.1 MAG: ABC-type spermidine/putrescine transport system, permease component II [uncultured Paraburkholderia sp.]CAH2935481.1 MAG: ABC-type spermidine/putrescine transport system, permease component II [uncultured Paraburkholderia sp.]